MLPSHFDILSRYVKFVPFLHLQCSASAEVTVVANIFLRDVRSDTGANVQFLVSETGLDMRAGASQIKKILTFRVWTKLGTDEVRIWGNLIVKSSKTVL